MERIAKQRCLLSLAQRTASELIRSFSPACLRIETAGSLRRGRPYVGDIDLVAIAAQAPSLFERTHERTIHDVLHELVAAGRITMERNGEKQKSFGVVGDGVLRVELYLTTAAQYGVQMAIRTGPSEFSRRIVTSARHGGLLRDGLRVSELRVWPGEGDPLETAEERDFFERATVCGWIEPEERIHHV